MQSSIAIQAYSSEELQTFFLEKGYEIIALTQLGSHIVGTVRKNDTVLFLKLAPTIILGKATHNEAAWYDNMHTDSGTSKLPIYLPKVQDRGEFKEAYWFIAEYIDGQPLVNLGERTVGRLVYHLPQLVETARRIMSTYSYSNLPVDEEQGERSLADMVLGNITAWREQIPQDISVLYEFVQARLPYLQAAPIHGDFTPWHFLYSRDTKLALIDAEKASMKGIAYYDIAYFFHRTYTKLLRPDLAKQFLELFLRKETLTANEIACLELCLAYRLIGGYVDLQTDTLTDGELQERMVKELVAGSLL